MKDFETTEVPSIQFIGYRIPQHKQNNYTVLLTRHQSTKVCREILVFKIFFLWRPFTQPVSLIFSYSSFRCGYLDNQSGYPKSLTRFCLLILCEWMSAFILLVRRYPIPDKFTRANLGRFNSYPLLTLTNRKNRLNYTFIVNSIYQAFFWYIVCWDVIETSARTNFFPEGYPRRWEVTLNYL